MSSVRPVSNARQPPRCCQGGPGSQSENQCTSAATAAAVAAPPAARWSTATGTKMTAKYHAHTDIGILALLGVSAVCHGGVPIFLARGSTSREPGCSRGSAAGRAGPILLRLSAHYLRRAIRPRDAGGKIIIGTALNYFPSSFQHAFEV